MPNSLVTGIALLIIGGLCGLALTQTHKLTRAPIEENRTRQAQALLSAICLAEKHPQICGGFQGSPMPAVTGSSCAALKRVTPALSSILRC